MITPIIVPFSEPFLVVKLPYVFATRAEKKHWDLVIALFHCITVGIFLAKA